MDGLRFTCPAGVYGAAASLSTARCSGPCLGGYYCPPNSTTSTQQLCGSASMYCPSGTVQRMRAVPGEYTVGLSNDTMSATVACPSGSYCIDGVAALCPAGRFGCAARLGDASCNGLCVAGHYCTAGSTSNVQHPCGGTDALNSSAASVFCLEGSAHPMLVGVGNYSIGSGDDAPHKRTMQAVCEPGSYCIAGIKVRDL